MVKTTINIKTRMKVKNIEIEEYEKIMDVWRACMLFFEREVRKLHDKGEISDDSLRKVAHNIDFTELLRMTFLSINDQDRMRLVKLKEVAEAIQRVQQLSKHELQEFDYESSSAYAYNKQTISDYQQYNTGSNIPEQEQIEQINPISSILHQDNQIGEISRPEINVKEHLNILQRNTASSVVELRKLMYQNIQKIRQTLTDESL